MSTTTPLPLSSNYTSLQTTYHDLTHHIVPGPNSYDYLLSFLLLPLALLIPPSLLSHRQLYLTILPLLYACQLHAWLTVGGDVLSINLCLWSFLLLALRDPRVTHRRVRVRRAEGKAEEVVEEWFPESFAKRILWVLTLLVSIRLTGWKIGEESHDRTQPPRRLNRRELVKTAARTVVFGYLILDATSCYVRTDPYFFTSRMSVDAPYPPASADMPTALVLLSLLPPRLLRSSIIAGQTYAMVTSMFYLPVLPAVGLNYAGLLPDGWSPHTWTTMFGDFSAVSERGLRGLWGSWWHGMNKQITAAPGKALSQALGIPPKSTARYAMITTSAFFLSGVIHMGMIPPEPKSSVLSANEMRFCIGAFFWAQIPAFGIEEAVSKVVARLAPQVRDWRISRVVVLAWTAGWLCLTFPIMVNPFREIGYWTYHAVPISLIYGLAGERWIMWS